MVDSETVQFSNGNPEGTEISSLGMLRDWNASLKLNE
jgi:hypothetical protein